MNLQLDTTVLYARDSRTADVTVAQTRSTKSLYNTYLHVGLPPGPIDSPGHAAIQAALHPTPGHRDWRYFLTVNPKTGADQVHRQLRGVPDLRTAAGRLQREPSLGDALSSSG